MDYNALITAIVNCGAMMLAIMAVLVFATNIIVEVVKGLLPKVPTNIVAVVVALIVTVLALIIACAVMAITIMWYYAVGAVVLGIFVAYAAMFGFDNFKAAWEKIKPTKKMEYRNVMKSPSRAIKAQEGDFLRKKTPPDFSGGILYSCHGQPYKLGCDKNYWYAEPDTWSNCHPVFGIKIAVWIRVKDRPHVDMVLVNLYTGHN